MNKETTMNMVTMTFTLPHDIAAKVLSSIGTQGVTGPKETKVAASTETKKAKPETKKAKPSVDESYDEDEETEEAGEEETEEAEEVSFDEVVRALKKLNSSFEDLKEGKAQRTKLFKKFKIQNASDLKESDYQKFIDACREMSA